MNTEFHPVPNVREHLFMKGMDRGYTRWVYHGEEELTHLSVDDEGGDDGGGDADDNDEMVTMIRDCQRGAFMDKSMGEPPCSDEPQRDVGQENDKFARTLIDAQRPLYPNCHKFSNLSFLVKLLHIKNICSWSNESFNLVLDLFKEALPEGEALPTNYYEAKSIIRDLGLRYVRIHACMNDCVLFWKEHADKENCPVCGESRWRFQEDKKKKKVAKKVLFYFPLKKRLQQLFLSKKTTSLMSCHKEKRVVEDTILRHPADSEAWKKFDKDHEWFAQDPRNVRFGLASDGFNPFGNMSTKYSIWPVVLMSYNLPPWKCMKEQFFMLSLLIPRPNSPGNDIDVYLRPLIDEMKELWENGVDTYDAVKEQYFRLHAAILWTINDFSAYANLSGWSTKGKLACPTCNKDTCHLRLKHGFKTAYMDHRRFLPLDHPLRKKTRMFNGKQEHRPKPIGLSGDEVLEQLSHIGKVTFGKSQNKKRKRTDEELNWLKKSTFFELPYWRTLLLRHNLDVMHIEKNICDSVLGTLMNIEGKTKDTVKARKDLKLMGIRKELHLQENKNGRQLMPQACFTLPKEKCKDFCDFIKSVKFPDGYASNVSRCISTRDGKISGLKSHDCHVFL
ncbi:uncharacterized protein LOC119984621 [Tripterygium wilfordii]|uniref:uncharacterized protein LOC119984621 n=1 Tax=Tripterygium wilfordii TaxID=458696 RepID=UPI0018F85A83|nr:uncharacterized protein LOC119984621 [Tripterygium wilfordii]XP_038684581.1 uncharacterized protein LOC119984621 [Tripterygium wilfordii]XP_038684583.1 uncharacterized protein LOC119984621 [Tripterygium wilfordii]XP_038684584.1 uncharacterized protein LOC119984621 [Tripterygium wilfordii]XP_038684585.1 uncharacterized protein LOC119984621 [Tripterygium wilfordii]XP_038684586.1 uncharacterized protein LOC119984621 [Tripterygium wilfordii]XP_038684587.1 uncharacterized protein LOC119984621 [